MNVSFFSNIPIFFLDVLLFYIYKYNWLQG